MPPRITICCLIAALSWMAFIAGCGQEASRPIKTEPSTKIAKSNAPERTQEAAPAKQETAEPEEGHAAGDAEAATPHATSTFASQLDPAELIMPKVQLTQGHAETCLVKVGDTLPDVRLPDLAGREKSLSKLLGSKLTVVLFWRSSHPYDVEELADLGPDVALPYSGRVSVVAINEDDPPEKVKEIAQAKGVDFPVLLDSDGKALGQVASKKLPRTYLLDSDGKIVWFDIEYSRSTRRDLMRAIRFTLGE